MNYPMPNITGSLIYPFSLVDVVDSGPFRYVSAFMNAKPYVKYISLGGMSMLAALKLLKSK